MSLCFLFAVFFEVHNAFAQGRFFAIKSWCLYDSVLTDNLPPKYIAEECRDQSKSVVKFCRVYDFRYIALVLSSIVRVSSPEVELINIDIVCHLSSFKAEKQYNFIK